MSQRDIPAFQDLKILASYLRENLDGNSIKNIPSKKTILIFAYNGTGKTRLSMEFKDIGKIETVRDTLYFNAFTEDLFTWNNDLDGDLERFLIINKRSR